LVSEPVSGEGWPWDCASGSEWSRCKQTWNQLGGLFLCHHYISPFFFCSMLNYPDNIICWPTKPVQLKSHCCTMV
jgi:hypothetical protein